MMQKTWEKKLEEKVEEKSEDGFAPLSGANYFSSATKQYAQFEWESEMKIF